MIVDRFRRVRLGGRVFGNVGLIRNSAATTFRISWLAATRGVALWVTFAVIFQAARSALRLTNSTPEFGADLPRPLPNPILLPNLQT